jgi:hypothetical protein
MHRLRLLFVLGCLAACGRPEAGAPKPLPASAPASVPASACSALMTEFDARLKAADMACSTVADCGCYGDLRVDGRLGVADKQVAATLNELAGRYRQQRCPTIFASSAGPPRCSASCQAGRCQ